MDYRLRHYETHSQDYRCIYNSLYLMDKNRGHEPIDYRWAFDIDLNGLSPRLYQSLSLSPFSQKVGQFSRCQSTTPEPVVTPLISADCVKIEHVHRPEDQSLRHPLCFFFHQNCYENINTILLVAHAAFSGDDNRYGDR